MVPTPLLRALESHGHYYNNPYRTFVSGHGFGVGIWYSGAAAQAAFGGCSGGCAMQRQRASAASLEQRTTLLLRLIS